MATIKDDLGINLVSVWEMESGALTIDSHGSNTLTDRNTVGSGTGIQGGCGDFESGNLEALYIPDASHVGLDITGDLTMAAWIKKESDQNMCIMGKFNGDGDASQRAYCFMLDANTSTSLDINISNGSTATWKYVTWSPTTGTWYHIAVVYTASAGSATFYVNGSQQGTTQTGLPTSITNNSIQFTLGSASSNAGAFSTHYDGLIDQACIWSRTLSSAEISTLYNAGAGIPYQSATPTTVTPPPQIITW